MKKAILLVLISLLALTVAAQLPQFSSTQFEDWIYTNPATELNQSNIVNNKIYLYKTSTGLDLTLTSPLFSCHKGETIDMEVTWIIGQWQAPYFVVSKVALTAAILDESGVTRTNYVNLSIPVPSGLTAARLRFAAWKGDVNSCGAVRQIKVSSFLRGDVNLDGEITVADVNAVVHVILGNITDEGYHRRADVNGDGEVNLADINSVIDFVVG